eukprot:366092-Chlamydomonas_euryale.AAC.10
MALNLSHPKPACWTRIHPEPPRRALPSLGLLFAALRGSSQKLLANSLALNPYAGSQNNASPTSSRKVRDCLRFIKSKHKSLRLKSERPDICNHAAQAKPKALNP